jgi:hypothetical protein
MRGQGTRKGENKMTINVAYVTRDGFRVDTAASNLEELDILLFKIRHYGGRLIWVIREEEPIPQPEVGKWGTN